MSRKIALPLLVAAALVSIILASRTPQPIIEELPPEEADAPTALLTQTEKVSDQTVTLRVYEPDEAGYARYALLARTCGDRHTVRRESRHLDREWQRCRKSLPHRTGRCARISGLRA